MCNRNVCAMSVFVTLIVSDWLTFTCFATVIHSGNNNSPKILVRLSEKKFMKLRY